MANYIKTNYSGASNYYFHIFYKDNTISFVASHRDNVNSYDVINMIFNSSTNNVIGLARQDYFSSGINSYEFQFNAETNEFIQLNTLPANKTVYISGNRIYADDFNNSNLVCRINWNNYSSVWQINYTISYLMSGVLDYRTSNNKPSEILGCRYLPMPTQLNATADKVYEGTFFGINGVETGTLATNLSNTFDDTNMDIYTILQKGYDNMETIVLTDNSHTLNSSIRYIPSKSNGASLVDTSQLTNASNLFANFANFTGFSSLNTSNITNTTLMFRYCNNLTTIPMINTSNVTTMTSMFFGCKKLITIPLLDMSNVIYAPSMFMECHALTSIPLLDTSNIINMNSMFFGCNSLTTIPFLDTSNANNMNDLFDGCRALTEVPLLNTSNVTSMSGMFEHCVSLTTIPQFNTSKVTNMGQMLYNCPNITEIPLLNTSSTTNMMDMFEYCSSLTTIPQLDTSNVTTMSGMFMGCSNLITVPLLNTNKVTSMSTMFKDCSNLSEASLNNILTMCANSRISSYKTLKQIGLTQEQANICTTLSNYQNFLNAGWTTGY